MVYLQADARTLLQRISQRDRAYERDMDPDYIEALRQAYDHYFSRYGAAPMLAIDTNDLDIVRSDQDRSYVMGLIRTTLEQGAMQQPLPELRENLLAPPRLRQRWLRNRSPLPTLPKKDAP